MKKDILYRLFSHIPTLETDRLILRGMRVSDAEDMYAYAKRPSVTQYLTWNPHTDPSETREYLTYVGQRYRTGDFSRFIPEPCPCGTQLRTLAHIGDRGVRKKIPIIIEN